MCYYSGIVEYEYKGYRYQPIVEDRGDDMIRVIHRTVSPDNEVVFLKANDYSYITENEFKRNVVAFS